MTFSTTSKFVQLSPYLVMEYRYADQPNPETYFVNTGSPTVGYNKLVNGVLEDSNGQPSNDIQIFNLDENASVTQNTSNNSVVQVNQNSFVTLNPNLVVPYNDFNSDLTSTVDLPITFPSNITVIYDSIRYHILAGYNLDNVDGVILQVQYPDVDGSFVTFSQIRLAKGSSQTYTLNPNPVTIGSNIFDKYYEVKIPSLVDMNNQYGAVSGPNKQNTLAGKTSKSGNGFLTAAPIRIKAYEILNTTSSNGYDTYGADLLASLSLESTDPFKNIGAYISPSDQGDFFEYFATDNGGFPEDFILFQNSIGNSYYIQHSVEVLEQVGGALLNTSNFTSIQTTAYDIPNLFRPIVRYTASAVSFTLRYTMTLVNNKDQSRLIRLATYNSTNVGRYGADIQPLQLAVLPQQQKIYNKVAGDLNISVPSNNVSPRQITKYANVFVDRTLVNTSLTNLTVEGTTIQEDSTNPSSAISYGVGKAYITVSPFDNYYKFTFYQRGADGTTREIDLSSSGTFTLTFINNKNNKVTAPSIADNNIAKPSKGELAFKVDETLSLQILQFTNRKFYVTNRPKEEEKAELVEKGVSRINKVARRLSSRSFSLNDSLSELKSQIVRGGVVESNNRKVSSSVGDTARISAKSSSVLYWGNWLKEGEDTPSVEAPTVASVSPVFQTLEQANTVDLSSVQIGQSSWQKFGTIASASSTTSLGDTNTISTVQSSSGNLSPGQLRSAIASDVQGKISTGWSTPDIISYFLDPSSTGFQVYSGITKEIFTLAVTGIFSNDDLSLVSAYGNTGGGISTGGSASSMGSNNNQTGGDSGSPSFSGSGGRPS